MTHGGFRAAAEHALPTLQAGTTYFVDHHDQSVYFVLVWANQRAIAADQRFEPGDPQWREEYTNACDPSRASTTRHMPRRVEEEP